MQVYATHTGTKRNLNAMQSSGWRILLTPDTLARNGNCVPNWPDGRPVPYALDNGAWGCFQRGVPFDDVRFLRCVENVGEGADWIVLPDIVGEGDQSLARSISWLPRLPGRVLLPVQNGMTVAQVAPYIGGRVGIFVGGDTEWKLRTLPDWGRLARDKCAWLHVGRVNTIRRIAMTSSVGAHSVDGTSGTRFAKTIPVLEAACRRYSLFQWEHPWAE